MLTYRLVNNLKISEDSEWRALALEQLGSKVHPSRQRGFCLARSALRDCFQELGYEIPLSELVIENYKTLKAQPGFTLSLTHSHEWGAALVGNLKEYVSVGIDVEARSRTVKPAILERVSHPLDHALLPIEIWALKEAAFKTLMNTGKFSQNEEFSSIQITDGFWLHSPSNTKGEWKLGPHHDLVVATAWIRI